MSRARTQRKLAKAIKFAALRAQGMTQVEAWRAITPNWADSKEQSQYQMASDFARDPVVRQKVEQVLQEANMAAFMSGPRFAARTADLIELAIAQENMTAAMAGQRILGQTTNNLRENLTLTDDRGVSDAQLIQRFAALDPAFAASVAARLGLGATLPAESDSNVVAIQPKPLISKN